MCTPLLTVVTGATFKLPRAANVDVKILDVGSGLDVALLTSFRTIYC